MTKKKPNKRKYNLRHISRQRSYSLYEIAELLGVNYRTPGNWIKEGKLTTIDDKRPYLVHGSALYDCCKVINDSFKRPCEEGELYCFGCQHGTSPKDNLVTLHLEKNGCMKIIGECSECGCKQHRLVSESSLFRYRNTFTLLQSEEENRKECGNSDYNLHLQGKL